jgi:hypothetical protein
VSSQPIEIRAFRAGDETGIIDCLNRIPEKPHTLEEWSWRFPPSSSGRPIVIALRGEEVVAHVAATPARFQIDDRVSGAAAIESGVADPAVGNADARRELLSDVAESLIFECLEPGDIDLVYFFGDRDDVTEWAAAVDGSSVNLPGIEVLRRHDPPPSRIRRLAYRAEPARDWEPRLDGLWQRARGAYPAATVRDAEYSLARYSGHPTVRYHRFLVFSRFAQEAVAFAVFCCDEGTCRWIDLVWDHRHPGALDLLSHVSARLARQVGVETEEVGLAGDPEGRNLLNSLGFVEQPPAIPVGLWVRSAAPEFGRIQTPDRFFATVADLRSR